MFPQSHFWSIQKAIYWQRGCPGVHECGSWGITWGKTEMFFFSKLKCFITKCTIFQKLLFINFIYFHYFFLQKMQCNFIDILSSFFLPKCEVSANVEAICWHRKWWLFILIFIYVLSFVVTGREENCLPIQCIYNLIVISVVEMLVWASTQMKILVLYSVWKKNGSGATLVYMS